MSTSAKGSNCNIFGFGARRRRVSVLVVEIEMLTGLVCIRVEAILKDKTLIVALPGSWPSDLQEDEDLDGNPWVTDSARMISHYSLTFETSAKRLFKTPRSGRRFPAVRRIVESSESEHSESESESPVMPVKKQPAKKLPADEVIELTSSSEDEQEPEPPKQMRTSHKKASQDKLPSYLTQEDGGAILILYVGISAYLNLF